MNKPLVSLSALIGLLALAGAGYYASADPVQISISKQPPSLEGTWYIDSPNHQITFSQNGSKLTGFGDESGSSGRGHFVLEDGKVEGLQVQFYEKFAKKSPAGRPRYKDGNFFRGNLAYHHAPNYKGWMLEGVTNSLELQGVTSWYAWKGLEAGEFCWPVGDFCQATNRLQSKIGAAGDRIIIPKQPPSLSGIWKFSSPTYFSVTLSQDGTKLTGNGDDGRAKGGGGLFVVQNGTVVGSKVHFTKKYLSNPSSRPLEFTGDLAYHYAPYYKGWVMEGQSIRLALPNPAHNAGLDHQTPCPWLAFFSAGTLTQQK